MGHFVLSLREREKRDTCRRDSRDERDREERGTGMKVKKQKKLEMCQYDTDAPAEGHPHPHAGILQKMKLKKGHNSHNNWQILP